MVIKNDVRWLKESEVKSNSHLEHDTKPMFLTKTKWVISRLGTKNQNKRINELNQDRRVFDKMSNSVKN